MNVNAMAVEISADLARDWVKSSLGGGHEISAVVLEGSQLERGTFRAIFPEGFESGQVPNFEHGGVAKKGDTEAALARVFDEMAERGAACVVVEDDLALRTDPAIERSSEPLAFIGERVISWCDLSPGAGNAAVDAVRVGSGYPTNAFVVSRSAADLGLAARRSMPDDFGEEIAQRLLAVVVTAFDSESYVFWTQS